MSKVSFIGLGKLGLPLCTCLGKNDVDVLAIDINKTVINKLKKGISPFYETGLQRNIDKSKGNVEYTTSYEKVSETDTSIILVNTPSVKKDGSFSNLYIEQSIKSICEQVKHKDYHLFIISSTVMPGSLNDSFIPLIESLNQWTYKKNFDLCYIPDFVALGTVIDDFENPEFVVLGESSKKAGDKAVQLYTKVFKNNPPIKRMSLVESELAKVSLNAYICMKISFANFLGDICEKYQNANPDKITSAIGIDKRISTKYFKAGLAFGGTCFPRDTWAFMKLSDKLGLDAIHIKAAEDINQKQNKKLLSKVLSLECESVGILGLSFKNTTPVINESPSVKLIESLLKYNIKVNSYDPVRGAVENTREMFGDQISYYDSYSECVKNSECVIIFNPCGEYHNINEYLTPDKIVIDCWRYYDNINCRHIKLGLKE